MSNQGCCNSNCFIINDDHSDVQGHLLSGFKFDRSDLPGLQSSQINLKDSVRFLLAKKHLFLASKFNQESSLSY